MDLMPDTMQLSIPVAYNVKGSRVGGINLVDEPVNFQGQYSPQMVNMIVERTLVRKRQGSSRLGTGDPMSGIGCALISYVDAAGVMHLIAMTTTSAYEYNSTTDAWDDISESEDPWTGDQDDVFGWDVVTDATTFTNNGGSALCVVNNVDDVKFYEGQASGTFVTLEHGFTSFASCRDLKEFWNHLFFLGYTDSATRVRSLAFAAFGDTTDWSGITAGQTTLTDTVGAILRAAKLGQDMMIYSERSISRCQYVGGATYFVIPVVVQGTGLLSESSLCSLVKSHFFLATDQRIYSLTQSGALGDIGEVVCDAIFRDLDMSLKARIVAGYDLGRQKVMFFIPGTGDSYPSKCYAINTGLAGLPWEYHEFPFGVRSVGILRRTAASAYCDDTDWASLYADEVPGYADDKYGQEGYDMTCILTYDGYVYKLDEATGYDGTSNINCEYQTEDIAPSSEEEFFRTLWFSFISKATVASTVYVYYSTDEGDTWTALADSPVTLSTSWATYRLPLDVTARRIRFRLVQQGFGDLQLREAFTLEIVPSTSRD